MDWKKCLLPLVVILLLFVDFLTFHDLAETHTIRDWLTLLASILVFVYFALPYFKSKS